MGNVRTAQDTSVFAHRIKVERAKEEKRKLELEYAGECFLPTWIYSRMQELNEIINAPLTRHDEA